MSEAANDAARRLGAELCQHCKRADVELTLRDPRGLGRPDQIVPTMTCDRCWIDWLRAKVGEEQDEERHLAAARLVGEILLMKPTPSVYVDGRTNLTDGDA